jgi:hypothetical protein
MTTTYTIKKHRPAPHLDLEYRVMFGRDIIAIFRTKAGAQAYVRQFGGAR